MILIKGTGVILETEDGKLIRLPKSYGIIHDPNGKRLPKCEVYFGPFRAVTLPKERQHEIPSEARWYFGRSYTPRTVSVDRPIGPWNSVARVVRIFYKRPGTRAPGGYKHPFRGRPLTLSKSGRFYRLSLPDGCIVDDRGFVFP